MIMNESVYIRARVPCDDRVLSLHCCSYIIEHGVCILALCEPSYPPRLAYSYLDNLQSVFNDQYGQDVYKAKRPYHFIEFGTRLQ